MKKIFLILLFNSVLFTETNKVTKLSIDNITYKGKIQGIDFTMYLKKGEIIDCHLDYYKTVKLYLTI